MKRRLAVFLRAFGISITGIWVKYTYLMIEEGKKKGSCIQL